RPRARAAVGRERRNPDTRSALDHAVLPGEGLSCARRARARARRLAVPYPRAGRRVLPVAVAAGAADRERGALSTAQGSRRARAVGALFLAGPRAGMGAP